MSFLHSRTTAAILRGWLAVLFLAAISIAQGSAASDTSRKVVKIDEKQFFELLKPQGRPILINFWATWCVPCREEFPDLVKIDSEFRGKIDFITISLDFEEELETSVPEFLAEMKATMPTYLLITPDETAAIAAVSKDWGGGLPYTILLNPDGEITYSHQGVVKHSTLQAEINKLLAPATAN
jgi:thiol-disulfide isomerase/thioredoxin